MLQETVEVWSSDPAPHRLPGVAFLRRDPATGLPYVYWYDPDSILQQKEAMYHLHELPAAWHLRAPRNTGPGPLLTAWQEIEQISERLRLAEQETEQDERDRAERQSTDNRISQEIERWR